MDSRSMSLAMRAGVPVEHAVGCGNFDTLGFQSLLILCHLVLKKAEQAMGSGGCHLSVVAEIETVGVRECVKEQCAA
jgi:hypothetical protein